MNSQTRQILFLLLAVIGLVSTWYHNLQFMAENGTSLLAFIQALEVNHATQSIARDISVVFLAFALWVPFEARRTGVRHWWAFIVFGATIALAFTFPLFLYFRERRLAQAA